MKSNLRGKSTLAAEVTQIDEFGIWLLINGKEYFLDFESFPWFRNATIDSIQNVQRLNEQHLHWPDLDVDLDIDSIEHPERYPLIWNA